MRTHDQFYQDMMKFKEEKTKKVEENRKAKEKREMMECRNRS